MNMKKIVTTLSVFILVFSLSLVVFGQEVETKEWNFPELQEKYENGEKIVIGYAPTGYEPTNFAGLQERGALAALDELGLNYEWALNAPSEYGAIEEQNEIIESLIERGVDVVWFGPQNVNLQRNAIKRLNEASIPVFMMGTSKPDVKHGMEPWPEEELPVISWIAEDYFAAGRQMGHWIVDRLEGEGEMAIIYGPAGDWRTDGRGYTAKGIIEGESDIKVVYEHHADWQEEEAFRATQFLFTAHPDIDLIYGMSSAMALGATSATKVQGKLDEVIITGMGGINRELKSIADGELDMTLFRDTVSLGRKFVDGLMRLLKGEPVPVSYSVEMIPVTSVEDIREYVPGDVFDVDEYLEGNE